MYSCNKTCWRFTKIGDVCKHTVGVNIINYSLVFS